MLSLPGGANWINFISRGNEKTSNGHLTSNAIAFVTELPPFANTTNVIWYVVASAKLKVSYLQGAEESGDDGHPGYVTLEYDDVSWYFSIGQLGTSVAKLSIE